MAHEKKVRKFIDVELGLDFKIKHIAINQSILKGKTILERDLILKWIEEGVNKSLKDLKTK